MGGGYGDCCVGWFASGFFWVAGVGGGLRDDVGEIDFV